MKLSIQNVTLHIDTTMVDDPAPTTAAERVQWANDAISEVNNLMKRKHGLSLSACVEDSDITTK